MSEKEVIELDLKGQIEIIDGITYLRISFKSKNGLHTRSDYIKEIKGNLNVRPSRLIYQEMIDNNRSIIVRHMVNEFEHFAKFEKEDFK